MGLREKACGKKQLRLWTVPQPSEEQNSGAAVVKVRGQESQAVPDPRVTQEEAGIWGPSLLLSQVLGFKREASQ